MAAVQAVVHFNSCEDSINFWGRAIKVQDAPPDDRVIKVISTDFILLRPLRLKIDLIPGPPHNDKMLYSKSIQVIARYPAQELASAISDMAAVDVVTEGLRDARAWQWMWRDGDRRLRIGFTVMGSRDDAEIAWGGSTIDADCYVGDLLSFWAQLRKTHADTWLHYDGRVYTADGFIERIREMLETQVITDIV